jgi:membrane associated rhomboid family serine protease
MNITPVARNLLIACVVVFLLQKVTGPWLELHLALWPFQETQDGNLFMPWQLVSYAFLHDPDRYEHIALNMFALYMFGPDIERLLGPRRFFTYYIVCAITAALTQLAVQHFFNGAYAPTVGASGAIFGILLAFALAFPHRKMIFLLLPIPMPAWLLVTLYGLIELYSGIAGADSSVAHFAHLGGMLGGFLLIAFWRRQVSQEPRAPLR